MHFAFHVCLGLPHSPNGMDSESLLAPAATLQLVIHSLCMLLPKKYTDLIYYANVQASIWYFCFFFNLETAVFKANTPILLISGTFSLLYD